MISEDTMPWTAGFQVGYLRGQQDTAAEAAGRSTRDPQHQGHLGEPPDDDPEWLDGFLEGYAVGRRENLRGAA